MTKQTETVRAAITAVGHYVPEKILSNAELEAMVDTTDEWIRTRTGIRERRIMEDGATSDMAARAIESTLKNRGIGADEIDVIIVASVSCIYGIGSPDAYYGMLVMLEKGMQTTREALLRRFVDSLYERSEDLRRGTFRVRGDIIEIYPTYEDQAYRIEMFGDQIDVIRQFDPITGAIRTGQEDMKRVPIYPKNHYVMPQAQRERAIVTIQEELQWWKKELEKQGKFVEAQRIVQRTMFDIEMMRTIGYCHGVENYSRHLSGRLPGEAPPTLLDYSSTKRTRPFRKSAPCITATARANRLSSTTVSACPARSTIARSPSRNSNTASIRSSTFPPLPVRTN